jgi:murein DD-endopeptidase MepM/ murein hydrolase activator NlpD
MINHFTVTIHDDNGVKQFKLHQFVKKAIIYAIAFIALIVFIGIAAILYLNDSVSDIENNILEVQAAYDKLQEKNKKLNKSIQDNQIVLFTKKEEISELSESLKEIENLMGLTPDENTTIEERINTTKMNSQHRRTLLQFIPSGSPVKYQGITSKYGYRIHPTKHTKEFHRGSDLKAAMDTPVYATADGIVEWAGYHKSSGYGKLVILEHNYGFKSYFGHLNKIVVKSNKFVKKGDLIAYTGNTGMSSGPHLHYEIKYIHRTVNPYWFIKWGAENYTEIFEKEKKIPWQSLITATQHIKVRKPTQTLPLSLREVQSKGK